MIKGASSEGDGMATDLMVRLPNERGQLARLGTAAGGAGVNLAGVCGYADGDEGVIHVMVEDDPAAARAALEAAGIAVEDQREVLVVTVEDKPGALGEVAARLSDAGVNIDLAYLATGTRLVFGVDDLEAARGAV